MINYYTRLQKGEGQRLLPSLLLGRLHPLRRLATIEPLMEKRLPASLNQHPKTDRLENDRIMAIDVKWDKKIFYPALIPKENAQIMPLVSIMARSGGSRLRGNIQAAYRFHRSRYPD